MLYILRLIITVTYSVLVCVFGSIYCLFGPRNSRYVVTFGHILGRLAPFFGLKMECRKPADAESCGNAIYTASHQNNYGMVTASSIVQLPIVAVGKKSLLQIPFLGQPYWLTGNLLVDRNNRTKAHGTITEVANHLKKRRISIWVFPEGTRSCGCGLLPFKTGTFHAAIAADVPIMPVCVFTTSNKISLNRSRNGLMTVKMLPPIDVSQYGRDQTRELAVHCCSIAEQKIAELSKEATEHEVVGKV